MEGYSHAQGEGVCRCSEPPVILALVIRMSRWQRLHNEVPTQHPGMFTDPASSGVFPTGGAAGGSASGLETSGRPRMPGIADYRAKSAAYLL